VVGLTSLKRGEIFAKDYRVLGRLSSGGMGGVYVAEQLATKAKRALKLMHPHLVKNPVMRKRFEQEAQVSARIKSDHVVQVIAAGVDDASGAPWLAMELVEGETLAQIAAREGALPPAYVGEVFVQLGHALGAAHRVGVVHRDLKPENVLIGRAQRVGVPFTLKVLDFGIAKVMAEALTSSTEPLGTPLWMSPEQTEHDRDIGPTADVWAMGLLAFFLLTGRHYWLGALGETNPVRLLREIAIEPLLSAKERAEKLGVVSKLPVGFDAWFARCVTRDVSARFEDAAKAQSALAKILGTVSIDVTLGEPESTSAPSGDPATMATLAAFAPEMESTYAPASRTGYAGTEAPLSQRKLIIGAIAGALTALVGLAAMTRLFAKPTVALVAPSSSATTAPIEVAVTTPLPVAPSAPTSTTAPSAEPTAHESAPSAPASPPRPPKKSKRPPFDRAVAEGSVRAFATHVPCTARNEPPESGVVTVTFKPETGEAEVVSVVGGSFSVSACVHTMLFAAHTRPFDGPPQSISAPWSTRL
jgi:serine/threonine protein kinase